ncbi:putative signal transducing protein [Massilia orientalis]|uniref:Signal transducing protein n=1 Tax=Massilia orientalis TaxID=3050128 RepID=A0ACC7MM50_9BURK|nr:DUF2007 domain-containing protein [Massilia sp. YIM B02787]
MHASNEPLDGLLTGVPDLARLPGRDLVEVARYLIPLEANLVQGCLVASGIPAVLADAHLVQTDMLLAPALGGVRILVPEDHLQHALAVLAAFARGEFELGEDADVSGA